MPQAGYATADEKMFPVLQTRRAEMEIKCEDFIKNNVEIVRVDQCGKCERSHVHYM